MWQFFLSGAYSTGEVTPYAVKNGFTDVFGPDLAWWVTLILVVTALATAEVAYRAVKRNIAAMGVWKGSRRSKNAEELDVEVWQEMEKDPAVREILRSQAALAQV